MLWWVAGEQALLLGKAGLGVIPCIDAVVADVAGAGPQVVGTVAGADENPEVDEAGRMREAAVGCCERCSDRTGLGWGMRPDILFEAETAGSGSVPMGREGGGSCREVARSVFG